MQRGLITIAAAAALTLVAGPAPAQEVVKIGMSFAMTGAGFAAAGRQAWAGARLYMQHHGNMVAGKKIEVIMRDDGGVADNARRLVQEMIVNDKVHIIGGGITPTVLAYGQLVSQAKIATVVMISGASVTTNGSPYFVRTSFILAQSSWIMGEWAANNGSKRVLQAAFHRAWRPDCRVHPHPARQSGLCAVSATHPRHQSRHGFHLLPGHASRHLCQAIRRERARQFRDQDHRARGPHRR